MTTLAEKKYQSITPVITDYLFKKVELLLRIVRTRAERERLSDFSDEQLRDIGITRNAAKQESRRALLDLPVGRW